MAPAAMKTMQIVVRVDPSFLGVLGNNAVVSADTYDPDNANNLATTATTVEGSADLIDQQNRLAGPGAGRQYADL